MLIEYWKNTRHTATVPTLKAVQQLRVEYIKALGGEYVGKRHDYVGKRHGGRWLGERAPRDGTHWIRKLTTIEEYNFNALDRLIKFWRLDYVK